MGRSLTPVALVRRAVIGAFLVAAINAAASPALVAQSAAQAQLIPSAPVLVSHPALLASVERISRGSSLWRDAIGAVRETGRRVMVVTPDILEGGLGLGGTLRTSLHPGLLAEAFPVIGQNLQVPMVVVVVNLPLMERIHERLVTVPRDFEADLDRILVHEVYGHAVPYLIAGDLSGRCADPKQGETAAEACAIQRENAVRTELGLGRRTDDGLFSLTLARQQALHAAGLN